MSVLDESRAVSARDLLLMLFTSLKHCGTWDVVAAVFKQKPTTFEKRVMSFLIVLHAYLMRTFVTAEEANADARCGWALVQELRSKKIYYSGKHSLYGHRVEVSVVPNGFTIDCTKFYKISVSDKTIFDENIDSHLANLAKRTGETTLEDSELGLEQWAVLADKGYQGIQHNVRTVLPLKKPAGGNSPLRSKRRMTTLWSTCSDTYRWSRKSYDIVFQACLALINVHVRLHPLCAEDGDANAQPPSSSPSTARQPRWRCRPEEIPDTAALEAFMHKLRDAERAVTCTHLVNYLKRYHRAWLDGYLANKNCGYQSLLKLAFTGFSGDSIINVDETGMTYDMPPHAIWSVRIGTAKIASGEKLSYRMTAVLGARANGEKLPILFIIRGMPGGAIEANEFESYPLGHHYAPQVREPTVLLLDNFDPHVSKEGIKIASEEAGCVVAAIPPNATSTVQPLDVGVMAPFKRHLRSLWLEEDLIEGSESEEDVDLMTVPAQKKRLVMIHRAIKAWAPSQIF
ncbi:hypothetical protein H257_18981 [Aphanomyces astaci]|uniref:DDE Tnp4 domain-containing protein n=1 Tax=Aphanomyces astaci TaxID=112090 RepID=W4FBB4_APHAT|nr:hypothetical protein H257_18981 [Aphanomyces astaci]ETV64081.1 hypothetical protein H257_18981 [Aphanomyces astaci]|eukprot:XP_009846435.1 hypothetical protein H257_18981 [Aphanomyces astaci]